MKDEGLFSVYLKTKIKKCIIAQYRAVFRKYTAIRFETKNTPSPLIPSLPYIRKYICKTI